MRMRFGRLLLSFDFELFFGDREECLEILDNENHISRGVENAYRNLRNPVLVIYLTPQKKKKQKGSKTTLSYKSLKTEHPHKGQNNSTNMT
jgi:hypothetical protein